MRRNILKSAIIVGNIQEYVSNKRVIENTPFHIAPTGESYYTFAGERIAKNEFEKKFPLLLTPVTAKAENSDKSNNWLRDEKSY